MPAGSLQEDFFVWGFYTQGRKISKILANDLWSFVLFYG